MGNSNKNRLLDQLGESNIIKQKIKKFQSEYKTKEKENMFDINELMCSLSARIKLLPMSQVVILVTFS